MIKKGLGVLLAVLVFAFAAQATDPGTVTVGGGKAVPLSYDIVVNNILATPSTIAKTIATVTLWSVSTNPTTHVTTQHQVGSAKTGTVVTFNNISPTAWGNFIVKGTKSGCAGVQSAPFSLSGPNKTITKYLNYTKIVLKPISK
jgi:hypothetical protein